MLTEKIHHCEKLSKNDKFWYLEYRVYVQMGDVFKKIMQERDAIWRVIIGN